MKKKKYSPLWNILPAYKRLNNQYKWLDIQYKKVVSINKQLFDELNKLKETSKNDNNSK